MTTRSSAVSDISASRWLDTKIVRPWPARYWRNVRTHRIPSGSSPLAGSSSRSVCGSPRSAAASPRRWRMPSENRPTRSPATLLRPDHGEHLVDAPRRQAVGRGHDPEMVASGAARVHVPGVEQRTDLLQRMGQRDVVAPVEPSRAGVGVVEPEHQPQRGRLAGTVGSEEAGDAARAHVEAEVPHRDAPAEALAEPADLDHGGALRPTPAAAPTSRGSSGRRCSGRRR